MNANYYIPIDHKNIFTLQARDKAAYNSVGGLKIMIFTQENMQPYKAKISEISEK